MLVRNRSDTSLRWYGVVFVVRNPDLHVRMLQLRAMEEASTSFGRAVAEPVASGDSGKVVTQLVRTERL